jgi:hypothetical protein
MPPTLGAAMGCVTSNPEPVVNMIGISPRTVVATVINFGRKRATDPSITAST